MSELASNTFSDFPAEQFEIIAFCESYQFRVTILSFVGLLDNCSDILSWHPTHKNESD